MHDRTPRGTLLVTALILASCAIPNGAAIRSALDEGDADGALDLARTDDRSLDYLAMEILRQGAGDEELGDEALAMIGLSRTRAKPLLRDLASGADDPVVRATAQSLLVRMGDRAYSDDLVDALESDLGLVRAAAVDALLGLDQSRSFHEHYILDTEPEVRRAVVLFLSSHDLPWSQDLLVDAARKDPDDGVRRAATRSLDPTVEENRDVLKQALGSNDGALRRAAARALGTSSSSMDLMWAAHLLASPATPEGLAFATTLLRTDADLAEAAGYLQEALHDPSPTMRHSVLVALTGTSTRVEGLDELAGDPSAQVRVAWCRLTRKLGTSDAGQRLEILESIVGGEEAGRDALVALAEEKGGYEKIRARVWWLLMQGGPDAQKYILAHAARPFDDPALAIWGMKAGDPVVRLRAAAAWLATR